MILYTTGLTESTFDSLNIVVASFFPAGVINTGPMIAELPLPKYVYGFSIHLYQTATDLLCRDQKFKTHFILH
jgi:hypothetical protein